jgi:hypothetical protein
VSGKTEQLREYSVELKLQKFVGAKYELKREREKELVK